MRTKPLTKGEHYDISQPAQVDPDGAKFDPKTEIPKSVGQMNTFLIMC